MKNQDDLRLFNGMVLAFFFTVILLLLTAAFLSNYKVPSVTPEQISAIFLPETVPGVMPKPQERFVMLALLLLLPLISFVAIKLAIKMTDSINRKLLQTMSLVLMCVTSLAVVSIFYNSGYAIIFFHQLTHRDLVIIVVLGVLMVMLMRLWKLPTFSARMVKATLVAVVLTLVISFPIVIFKISNINSINQGKLIPWVNHFEPVFYSVTQVMSGKTVMFNFPVQYGFYAELLKPIFYIVGLSVFKFTVVLAILQIIAMCALLLLAMRLMKNYFLILCCLTSITMVMFALVVNWTVWDPYYQYWPIRFFFPAVSLVLFERFVNKPSWTNWLSSVFFSAYALIWNIDSGVPVAGALLFYLATLVVFPRNTIDRKQAIKFLMGTVIIIVLELLLFAAYLSWKAQAIIHWQEILKYQQIFYVYGFMMLPIPRNFNVWQIIFGIYVFGMVSAIYAWIKQVYSKKLEVIFYLSILGLGLFSYYEGRSHVYNLVAVSWPAIMMLFIAADYLYFSLTSYEKNEPRFALHIIAVTLFLPIFLFGLLTTSDYFGALKSTYEFGKPRLISLFSKKESAVKSNLIFIQKNLHQKKSAVILSRNQAVYYGELGLKSSIDVPSLVEIITKSDLQNLLYQLSLSSTGDVFVELDQDGKIPSKYLAALKNYRVIDKSSANMIYLSRKE